MLAGNWSNRITFLRTYVLCIAVASMVWEGAQMPLYTLWRIGAPEELAADVLQCTGANIVIAIASLAIGLLLADRMRRLVRASVSTIIVTCLVGVGYTIYSEWVNVNVRGTWAYSDLMPVVPGLGVGLSPLVQWIVLPTAGILLARRWAR